MFQNDNNLINFGKLLRPGLYVEFHVPSTTDYLIKHMWSSELIKRQTELN